MNLWCVLFGHRWELVRHFVGKVPMNYPTWVMRCSRCPAMREKWNDEVRERTTGESK